MSKTGSGVDGVDVTISDSAFLGQFPGETVDSVFDEGMAALAEALEWAENGRPLVWTGATPNWLIRDGVALAALENMAGWATRVQVGFTNWADDVASFTGAISGTTLSSSAHTGYLYPGVFIAGTGVTAFTFIKRQLTGDPGGPGTYEVSISQTVSSTAMTSQGYHEGPWVHGDGVGVYIEQADGSPTAGPADADNIMGAAMAGARYRRACRASWATLYGSLYSAKTGGGDDATKITNMRTAIDTFDDAASWPPTNIS